MIRVSLFDDSSFDWRYLLPMLEDGLRLNVICAPTSKSIVEKENSVDTISPLLVILEPDYLVDISAIASCFESYAESPLVYLLNKIRPSQSSEALVLGNLASQLLDEEVHASVGNGYERQYIDSVRDFFKTHAISLLAANLSAHFHDQGRAQQLNIRRAVRKDLPLMAGHYDAREVMLEPSFFSELLGLQGRMDFLQLDHRLLIEQKSGKGAFPQPDPETPVPQLKHYIQLLLYMTLLKYGSDGNVGNDSDVQAFLLYSKYPNALQQVGFSEDMLFRAIRVRNGIVDAERQYARGGLNVLTTLTPETLNERGQAGKLWQQYVRPQLAALLAPLHTCSPLELAYYQRFLTFIAAEHWKAKVGTGTPDNAGFSAKWLQTLEEKMVSGDIFVDLSLISPAVGDEGRVDSVTLKSPLGNEWEGAVNFRVGDIVILYPYQAGTEPDVCRTMVFRGTIVEMTQSQIILSLRASQTDAHVFLRSASQPWAIEHDLLESSFAPLYRGMHAFLSSPQERRDLLLLQRPPRVDESRQLRLNHGDFNDLALRVRQALDLFLIIGPPGTGKTSFGLMTTLREELSDLSSSVLLLSYTNRAVDEICSKLTEAGIGFLRVGSRYSCAEEYRSRLLEEQVPSCETLDQLRRLLLEARVIVGTTTALSAHVHLLGLRSFSLAIIDEASQILEPHLMSLLAAQNEGRASIRKLVMIGDHKQLPAVVQQSVEESRVNSPELKAIGLTNCRLSLFERLLKKYADDPRVTYQLTRQGRMHPDIARFPNDVFYGGRLLPVPLPHQVVTLPPDDWPRIAFVDVPAFSGAQASEKVNVAEAEVIARYVLDLYHRLGNHFGPDSLGIIVPYRNQIAAVRTAIGREEEKEACHVPMEALTIDTVERYQGSQRDTIIYGLTVHHPAQIDFLTELSFEEDGRIIDRKLNVAMTRAREHLLLVGNAALLRQNPVYARLIDWIQTFTKS